MTTATPVELPLDDPRWTAYAAGHPCATIFHTPAWSRVIAESYGFRAFALGLEAEGRLVALAPVVEVAGVLQKRRWGSLPFTDSLPPLVDHPEDEILLVQALENARAAAGIAAVDVRAAVAGANQIPRGVEHVLALPSDPDELWQGFIKKIPQQIRHAERHGLTARIATAREDLVDRYFALHAATRKRQGVPTQPRQFFERLWEHMFEPGNGFVVFAELDGEAAGGTVFLAGTSTLIYKFSASSRSLWRLRPNQLILWTGMQEGISRGCTELNFGRTDFEDDGLRKFKSTWGARERLLVYSRLGDVAEKVPGRRGVAGRLAAAAIRRSPPIVSRSVGRLLYRFAA